jgi:hypothetical protein
MPQQMQQNDTTYAIINALPSDSRSRQLSQLGNNHYWIANPHSQLLYLLSTIHTKIDIQISHRCPRTTML